MDLIFVLLINTLFVGTALCIANVVGQCVVNNQSTTEGGITMGYATKEILCHLYWSYHDTERGFNYTGEDVRTTRWLRWCCDKVRTAFSSVVRFITYHRNKLTLLGIGGVGLLFYASSGSSEMLLGAAGLMGSPNSKDPNKKERKMNAKRILDRGKALGEKAVSKLISALFNTAVVHFKHDRMIDLAVYTLKFLPVNTLELPVTTPKVGATGEDEPMILDNKKCVYFSSSLEFDTLKYFHINLPSGDDTESKAKRDHMVMNLTQHLIDNDLVPFGSLKRDKKGRTKFYVLSREEAEKYSSDTGAFLPYFHKLLTDCDIVRKLNVRVVNPAKFDKDGNVIKHNELHAYGVDDRNDGAGLIRPCLGDRQFQAIPADVVDDKLPIAKGFLDSKLIKDDKAWETIFGDVDLIIYRDDQIKCFSDLANDGEWVVGFTYMDGGDIDYPFHWECTQFLRLTDEVFSVLAKSSKAAIKVLFDSVNTKEGLREYISSKISHAVRMGWDARIQMKVLAMLYTKATHRFVWVKRQIESMLLGDVWKITKSYGVFGRGIPLLTNDLMAKIDPRYVPYWVARAVGGDNDGDYIVYIANRASKKMLYWRFPVVGGLVIRDVPQSLLDAKDSNGEYLLKDIHPEIVDLYVKYAMEVPEFSRNDIIKERNTDPLNEAVYTAEDIILGEDIGTNTNNLKRLLSSLGENTYELCGYMDKEALIEEIHKAMICIESGAIALKYHVDGVTAPVLSKAVYELYPMEYTKARKPDSWLAVNKIIAKLDSGVKEFDSRLYSVALKEATVLFDGFMKDVISTKRMARYIDRKGLRPTLSQVKAANAFLKDIGIAFRGVFEKYEGTKDNDELLKAELSKVVRAAEHYGSTLDLDTLKTAIYQYLRDTKGTGACAVHMAGNRIPEVFGWEHDNAKLDLPEPKVGAVLLTAFRPEADIPFDKLKVSSGKLVGNQITFSGGVTLSLHKDSINRVPDGKITVINATRYITKTDKKDKSGKVIRKAGSVSNRTANLVCKVEAVK